MKKVLLALAALGCGAPESPPARPPTPVRVHVAGAEAAHAAARYTATVEPIARVDVAFRVGGYIEALGTTEEQG